LVISPEALRIERVRARDHSSIEAIKERMNHQMRDEEKIPLADYIIHNDTDHSLIEQVIAIHKKLLNDEI
jgi:dephospho-CoA kinase